MVVIEDKFQKTFDHETYIALGNFDGLHLGHIGLINKTIELSQKNKAKSMIYTFRNHSLSIINKERTPKLLMDNATKIKILDKFCIDIVNLVYFDTELMRMEPEVFIKNLVDHYKPKGLVVGFNYRYGYKNIGTVDTLKELSTRFGFELHIIDPVTFEGEAISSSRIRSLISDGNLTDANKMLLNPFVIKGYIGRGKQLGRKLGFPTANLEYDIDYVIPARGVYYTYVRYNGNLYKGITSVGFNPTVNSTDNKLTIETYILDFNKDIYGESIDLYFVTRMRDEIKFNSLEELIIQLNHDKLFAEKQKIENFV